MMLLILYANKKKDKAVGFDRLATEALYGMTRLFIHLTSLFYACICYCYLPSNFMDSMFIPLVKKKMATYLMSIIKEPELYQTPLQNN